MQGTKETRVILACKGKGAIITLVHLCQKFLHIYLSIFLRKISFSLISYLTELVKISDGGGLDGNL